MALTRISSSQSVTGEIVDSGFQYIIAGNPESTSFSISGYQGLLSDDAADDITDNYSRLDATTLHEQDAGQPGYIDINSTAAITGMNDLPAASLMLPSVNNNVAVPRRIKSNITADAAKTAFTGNVNISVKETSENPTEYKIPAVTGNVKSEFAAADYIVSGSSASINLTTSSGLLSGTATYRIDNVTLRAIDADKTGVDDNQLCWAATASNMLYWAGWGKNTGSLTVSLEDDLLDYYRENFTDGGGYIETGIEWFLDGKYSLNSEPGAAQFKKSGGGDFFPNITISNYLSFSYDQTAVMTNMDSLLRKGDVCGLSISWLSSGGHAVTCWGFSYDTSVAKSNKNYYTGVWISDSDDGLGRSAPDVVRYCPVSWSNTDQAYLLTYKPATYGILTGIAGLAPEPFSFNVYNPVSGETVHDGTQTVFAGGTTLNNIISCGGSQIVSSGGAANSTTINSGGSQVVSSGGIANSTTINSGGSQTVDSGTASDTIVNSGGSMYVSSGGIAAGALTLAGGHVTAADNGSLQPAAMSFKLAHAQTNDTLLTIESGVVGDISQTTFTLDVNNAATGLYILSSGADLTGMSGAVFTVMNNNGQNVNLQVGSSYTFADGDTLSLSLSDAATDQLTAVFSVGGGVADTLPPTVPTRLKPIVTGSRVAFDWAGSVDKGGIYQYEFQVDNNSNFSSPEYSELVTDSQASETLAVGTYYWHVRAQDNSGNWSAWSRSSSFVVTPVDAAGNTRQTASDISSLDNWVGFGDPADFYKLTMTNAGTLTLELTGLTGNANLSLLSAAGARVKTAAAGAANESITQNLPAGSYYVNISPGAGMNSVYYTLTNTRNYFPTDTAANTRKAAKDINSGVDNWVGLGDAADFYKLTMTNAGALTLNLTGLSGNANLYLLNAAGSVLRRSANAGIANEAINNISLLTGTYYVAIAAADGGKGIINTNYTLTNTVNYFPTDTAGNTFAAARQVTASDPVSEWLGFGDKDDYYKFELGIATTATLDLTCMTSNVNLCLYNSKGARLAVSANSGNIDENITRTLAAGTYYVRATLAGMDNTEYSLNFNIDPAAFKPGSLQLFAATGTRTGSYGTTLTGSDDPLKKSQGILAG